MEVSFFILFLFFCCFYYFRNDTNVPLLSFFLRAGSSHSSRAIYRLELFKPSSLPARAFEPSLLLARAFRAGLNYSSQAYYWLELGSAWKLELAREPARLVRSFNCKNCKRNLQYGLNIHDCEIGIELGKIHPDMRSDFLINTPWWKEPEILQQHDETLDNGNIILA